RSAVLAKLSHDAKSLARSARAAERLAGTNGGQSRRPTLDPQQLRALLAARIQRLALAADNSAALDGLISGHFRCDPQRVWISQLVATAAGQIEEIARPRQIAIAVGQMDP